MVEALTEACHMMASVMSRTWKKREPRAEPAGLTAHAPVRLPCSHLDHHSHDTPGIDPVRAATKAQADAGYLVKRRSRLAPSPAAKLGKAGNVEFWHFQVIAS